MNNSRIVKLAFRVFFVSFLIVLVGFSVVAQEEPPDREPDERKAVLLVVQEFFDTMTSKDVEGARGILIPEGRFHSVRDLESGKVIQTFTNDQYIRELNKGKERYRERMWNPEVHIRGFIATVWTPYDFWIDGKLSHCGYDSFNLVKSDGKWKIAGGVYTVEKDCKPSPLGPL